MTRTRSPRGRHRLRDGRLWAAVAAALLVDDVRARRRSARCEERLSAAQDALATQRRHGAEVAAELRMEARTDPLTGLSNRRRWQEQLVHELERARRTGSTVAVAVLDLDRFKDVNDTQGHEAGDELLRKVSDAFARSVRSIDLLARVGGEEFAIALPDTPAEAAASIVERVRTSVPPGVTCSAGIAVWDGTESLRDLQHRADAAMYRAKAAGRDRLVVA